MTFDLQSTRLLFMIEDILGVHRSNTADNFLIVEMDVRSIAPVQNVYERVLHRKLLAEYTFWERDSFWPSQGSTAGTGLLLAMPETRKLIGFSARRVLPGVLTILYAQKLILVQEEPDSMRALKYLQSGLLSAAGAEKPASDTTVTDELQPLINPQLRGLRALVPVDDLVALDAPRVVYVSPDDISAQGTTDVTIFGQNFGTQDTSPVIRIDGRDCGASIWISSVEVLCKNAPAVASGTLLDLVGGAVNFKALNSVAYFPQGLRYVSPADVKTACCRTCNCPDEIWTWESSGQHRIEHLLSRIMSNDALQLCGPSPRSCELTFVAGNSLLLVEDSLSIDTAGSLGFRLVPFQNGNATYELKVTDGYVEARKSVTIVCLAVNNAPAVTLVDGQVLEVCETANNSQSANHTRHSSTFVQVSRGAAAIDEDMQDVRVQVIPVSGDFATLFQPGALPIIYPESGVISFALVPGRFGSASFNVTVRDTGGKGTGIPGSPPACNSSHFAGLSVSCNWDEGKNTTLTIRVSNENTAPFFRYSSTVSVKSSAGAVSPLAVSVDGQGLLTVWEGAGELTLGGFASRGESATSILQLSESFSEG
jgi:hypothetical protein